MPVFTLETVRRNPWNAVEQLLPWTPSPLLLRTAWSAACYCRASELDLVTALASVEYPLLGRGEDDRRAEIEEDAAERAYRAGLRIDRIGDLCWDLFGVAPGSS